MNEGTVIFEAECGDYFHYWTRMMGIYVYGTVRNSLHYYLFFDSSPPVLKA